MPVAWLLIMEAFNILNILRIYIIHKCLIPKNKHSISHQKKILIIFEYKISLVVC